MINSLFVTGYNYVCNLQFYLGLLQDFSTRRIISHPEKVTQIGPQTTTITETHFGHKLMVAVNSIGFRKVG